MARAVQVLRLLAVLAFICGGALAFRASPAAGAMGLRRAMVSSLPARDAKGLFSEYDARTKRPSWSYGLGPLRQPFERTLGGIVQLASQWMLVMKKCMAALFLVLSALSNRIDMSKLAFGVGAGLFAVPPAAHAGVLRRYSNLTPTQKLATTPLFFVSNSGGSPYLQEDVQAGKPTQRIIVYFMSSEDANDYLDEMAQGSPGNINEFRIKTTSMEKVVNSIQKRKQSRKLGRYAMGTIFRIQPSSRQCQNAERVAGGSNPSVALKGVAIPMFTAKGMAMQRSSGEVLTPYYFAYEDMLEDWATLVKDAQAENRKAPSAKPNAIVKDFTEVMCLAQGITTETVRPRADGALNKVEEKSKDEAKVEEEKRIKVVETVGVVPPRREIDMLRNFYRSKLQRDFSTARIIGAPR